MYVGLPLFLCFSRDLSENLPLGLWNFITVLQVFESKSYLVWLEICVRSAWHHAVLGQLSGIQTKDRGSELAWCCLVLQ